MSMKYVQRKLTSFNHQSTIFKLSVRRGPEVYAFTVIEKLFVKQSKMQQPIMNITSNTLKYCFVFDLYSDYSTSTKITKAMFFEYEH